MNEYADLTYYQKSREVILNRAKYYYENDQEILMINHFFKSNMWKK